MGGRLAILLALGLWQTACTLPEPAPPLTGTAADRQAQAIKQLADQYFNQYLAAKKQHGPLHSTKQPAMRLGTDYYQLNPEQRAIFNARIEYLKAKYD